MAQTGERLLYWAPRLLGVLYALFLSVFALDVFGEGYGFWGTALALLIHLLPTILLAAALAGALLFGGLGLAWLASFALEASADGAAPSPAILVLPGPLILIGMLFLAGWLWGRRRA